MSAVSMLQRGGGGWPAATSHRPHQSQQWALPPGGEICGLLNQGWQGDKSPGDADRPSLTALPS